MSTLKHAAAMAACLYAASIATAAEFEDYAKVVSTTPQVEQYNQPRQECRTEYVRVQQPQQRTAGGAIVGGIAGGLLGSQVGGGHGKTAATAAGAIAGAIIGDRIDNNDNVPVTTEQPIRQCRMVDSWQSRTTGYQVTYEYRGRTYTTSMPYDPGDRVKLQVTLTPR
jgi:uncharacterized protein YcfJ